MDNFLERASKLNYNESLYVGYYKDMQSKGLRLLTKNRYLEVIIIFFEKVDKDIKDITNDDINSYLLTQQSDNNKNFLIGRLSDFEKYVRKNQISIKFDMSAFETIKSANIDAKHKARAMSLKEISDIRQLLWTKQNFRYLLLFELTYIYGLTLDELCECSIENFNRENCSLHLPSTNKNINIPERLRPYLLSDAKNILAKVTKTIIRYSYSQIGKNLHIDFC